MIISLYIKLMKALWLMLVLLAFVRKGNQNRGEGECKGTKHAHHFMISTIQVLQLWVLLHTSQDGGHGLGKDCRFYCSGSKNWFQLISILPYLRQCLSHVVDALQCNISPWYQRRAPNLHSPTCSVVTWILCDLSFLQVMIMPTWVWLRKNSTKRRKKMEGAVTYKNSMQTCCLSCRDVSCAVVQKDLKPENFRSVRGQFVIRTENRSLNWDKPFSSDRCLRSWWQLL